MRNGLALCVGACVLAGCGGGSDGGSVTTPPGTPTLTTTLSPASQSVTADEDDSAADLKFTASYTGKPGGAVYPDVAFDHDELAMQGNVTDNGSGSYSVAFRSLDDLGGGAHKGSVTFRLCRDAGCDTVYPGSTQSFSYTVDAALHPWATYQRTPRHTGYVHASFDPSQIKQAWQIVAPEGGYMPVAARGDTVFATLHDGNWSVGRNEVYAIDSATGKERWHYSMGTLNSASGPALSGDVLAVVTMEMSSDNNEIKLLDPVSGSLLRNMTFPAQWSEFAQPAMDNGALFLASGYYGNQVYRYDLTRGVAAWEAEGSGGSIWDGETVALDDEYVYYYSGNLDLFDRSTGARVRSIADPDMQWSGYSYNGGPIVGPNHHVLAYSGSSAGGSFPLVNFDTEAAKILWRTSQLYDPSPALAKGVVYANSNAAGRMEALDEETGKPLWSWERPAGEAFVGNVLATDTLIFVSTNKGVYAISTGNHQTVWSADATGALAITPDHKLIVAQQYAVNNASPKLVAFSLD